MINLILFGTFFIMLLLNIPIAVSLGTSAILAMLYAHDPFTVISTNVYNGMAKFLLLAIPFFVLSGNIMAKAGISTRLVNFIDDCVGHRRGGIAIVCVIVACFFGAISGYRGCFGHHSDPRHDQPRRLLRSLCLRHDGNGFLHRHRYPALHRFRCVRLHHRRLRW